MTLPAAWIVPVAYQSAVPSFVVIWAGVAAIVMATLWLARRLSTDRMARRMLEVSSQIVSGEPTGGEIRNSAPRRPLGFTLADSSARLTEERRLRKRKAVRPARIILLIVLAVDLSAAAVYRIAIRRIPVASLADVDQWQMALEAVRVLVLYTVIGFVLAFISTAVALHKRNPASILLGLFSLFTGAQLSRTLKSLTPNLRVYVNLGFASWLAGIAVQGTLSSNGRPNRMSGALAVLALAHAALTYYLPIFIPRKPNLRLVLLRVFGFDTNAEFTFNGIIDYWERYGNYFTVADASFLRTGTANRASIPAQMLVAFFLGLAVCLVADSSAAPYVVTFGVVMCCAALYVAWRLWTLDRSFVRSGQDLTDRLQRLQARPRKLNLTFKGMPVTCYDNTWKMAVSAFLSRADVVLMDLRQYSEQRKGCQYEVDVLFQNQLFNKVVFLASAQNAADVQRFLSEQWQGCAGIHEESGMCSPNVFIYVATRENDADVHAVLDLLTALAHREGAERLIAAAG